MVRASGVSDDVQQRLPSSFKFRLMIHQSCDLKGLCSAQHLLALPLSLLPIFSLLHWSMLAICLAQGWGTPTDVNKGPSGQHANWHGQVLQPSQGSLASTSQGLLSNMACEDWWAVLHVRLANQGWGFVECNGQDSFLYKNELKGQCPSAPHLMDSGDSGDA